MYVKELSKYPVDIYLAEKKKWERENYTIYLPNYLISLVY